MHVAGKLMQHLDDVIDVIIEIETASVSGTIRASVQSVMYTSWVGRKASTVPRNSVA